jgi:hypothetical protein
MRRLIYTLLGIAALCVIAFSVGTHAATPLPIAPAGKVWCFDSVVPGGGFRNVFALYPPNCATTPPVDPPPVAGRIVVSSVSYVPSGYPPVRAGVDMTSWASLFGHASSTDAVIGFPGRSNSQPTILGFQRYGCIALAFTPDANSPGFGRITHTDYNYGGDLTWSISTTPCDFNPPNRAQCFAETKSGNVLLTWTTKPSVYRTFCPTPRGATYFGNLKLTRPAEGTTTCAVTSVACAVGLSNGFGG